MVYHQEKNYD